MSRMISTGLVWILCLWTFCPAQAQSDWPPTKDAFREAATEWLRSANKFGPDHAIVTDMMQALDEEMEKDMNLNLFFGSDLMDSGKFQSMHLFCHQLLTFDMTGEQAAAMGLGNLSVTTTSSGAMGIPAEKASFELSQLVIRDSDQIGAKQKFSGKIRCRAVADSIAGDFALRVSYRGNAGISQFQYLDQAPDKTGTTIEFEFGPINEEDAAEVFTGPLAIIFDIVSVDQSGGDVKVYLHSRAIGTIGTVRDQ